MKHTPAELFKQWKRAALMRDRARAAIRERRRAGESVLDLVLDYNVPGEFVRSLCDWQLFGDDTASEVIPISVKTSRSGLVIEEP